jgi:hypothetical protein
MVTAALRSASLEYPKTSLLVDEIQRYKPAPEAYQALLKKAGKEGTPQDVYLLSRFVYSSLESLEECSWTCE